METRTHLGALTQPTPGGRSPGRFGEAGGACGKLGTGWRRRRARRAANVATGARAGPGSPAGTPRPRPPPPGRLPAAAPGCSPGGAAAPWPQGTRGGPASVGAGERRRPPRVAQAGRPPRPGAHPAWPPWPPWPFRLPAGAAPGAGRDGDARRAAAGTPHRPQGPRPPQALSCPHNLRKHLYKHLARPHNLWGLSQLPAVLPDPTDFRGVPNLPQPPPQFQRVPPMSPRCPHTTQGYPQIPGYGEGPHRPPGTLPKLPRCPLVVSSLLVRHPHKPQGHPKNPRMHLQMTGALRTPEKPLHLDPRTTATVPQMSPTPLRTLPPSLTHAETPQSTTGIL